MTTISPVHIPYSGGIPGGVHDGLDIQIQGVVSYQARMGFGVNLCQAAYKEPNTTLHFNPRFHQNCVVLNHMKDGSWGSEERRYLPFEKGTVFDIHIKVKHEEFKIKINGSHFTNFSHRMDKEMAKFLFIEGEVSVSFIRFSGHGPKFPGGDDFAQPGMKFQPPPYSRYPMEAVLPPATGYPGDDQSIYNPPVPFISGIPGGISLGRTIYISGIPNQHPSRFTINLQSDYGATDVALNFDVRFNFGDSVNVVVRNHCQRGHWGSEEHHVSHFPFMPNVTFDLLILVEHNCFKVVVNKQQFVEFQHRLPIQSATILSISGDIRLKQVRFQ